MVLFAMIRVLNLYAVLASLCEFEYGRLSCGVLLFATDFDCISTSVISSSYVYIITNYKYPTFNWLYLKIGTPLLVNLACFGCIGSFVILFIYEAFIGKVLFGLLICSFSVLNGSKSSELSHLQYFNPQTLQSQYVSW